MHWNHFQAERNIFHHLNEERGGASYKTPVGKSIFFNIPLKHILKAPTEKIYE